MVQKTRWYHISVSFVTSIYSGLGLRLVSSRFNDKNAFSKLKKISRFQLYVRAYVCIWTYTAPGLTILFLTKSAIGYCSHSNRKRPLLKFLNDREACQEKVGSGSWSTFFLKNDVLGLVLGLIEYWYICQSEGLMTLHCL